MTETQKQFIWLAHGECRSFSEIEKELNVSRNTLSQWEKDLREEWEKVAAVRRIHIQKKIEIGFKEFYDWFLPLQADKKCCYCGISEPEIGEMFDKKLIETKRSRGRKLELDRKEPESKYDHLHNIVYACYWCNQAKTDTFTHEEFLLVGNVIKQIWLKRLAK